MKLKDFKEDSYKIMADLDMMIGILEAFAENASRSPNKMYANFFLCNMCSGATSKYVMSQKPHGRCNVEFFNNPYYTGDFSWWDWTTCSLKSIILEKIRFVKHIKSKLV